MTSQADEDRDTELLEDVLRGRTFTIADLIAKEGGDFLKGESPVPRLLQAKIELKMWIKQHVNDSTGALKISLQDLVEENELIVSQHLENPFTALIKILENLIANRNVFYEFVKRVDMKWGQIYGERPHFQAIGQPPHPDDEYTHECVQEKLVKILATLKTQLSS
ncbi:MAG: hypothetical protein N5P05_000679 [Chroococcopsis gigantea SAG 12.99]|jgi:hypothetical protein|nr:hypothetical protein [Chlorogloea purpurea SAG 13.99]MDV2999073.1 hypothetical protein [Chroococcopsis gigantea SAG 12.99]